MSSSIILQIIGVLVFFVGLFWLAEANNILQQIAALVVLLNATVLVCSGVLLQFLAMTIRVLRELRNTSWGGDGVPPILCERATAVTAADTGIRTHSPQKDSA